MLSLPIYFTNTYKTKDDKTFLVGMNWFRNAHHHEQNKVKKYYHELIETHAANLAKCKGTYTLDIQVYYKNSACDGSNIASLMEKFVLDALQQFEIVEQDNVKYHLGTTWSVAGQDKENPRCEIQIIHKESE